MDNLKIIQEIRERFEKRLADDTRLKGLFQKLESENATLVDTDSFACRVAECYNLVLKEILGDASIEEYRKAIDAVIPKGFRQITDRVGGYAMRIIDQQLQEADIGMKAVQAEYDYRKEQEVIDNIRQAAESATEATQVGLVAARQIEAFSQKAAMNTIQTNAQAQNNAGLEVKVTRIYDGVGVHRRKDDCKWCLERCGNNMPYREAYSKGAFQRHPGCHCEIFYKPKKGNWQRQSNWKSNEWEESQERDILRTRQRYEAGTRFITPEQRSVIANYHLSARAGVRGDSTTRKELGTIDPVQTGELISYFQEQIRNDTVENAIVVDKTGKVIHFIGAEDGVSLFEVDFEGAHILHNHPISNGIVSFGADDFLIMRDHQDAVFDLCNAEYDYHLEIIRDISSLSYTEVSHWVSGNLIELYESEEDYQHLVMEALRDRGFVKYERRRKNQTPAR